MIARISTSQLLLKSLIALLIASPVVGLFGGAMMGYPTDLTPVMVLWCVTVHLYAVGFWVSFALLRRGLLHRRATALWWWSFGFGLLVATFVPLGTILAVPCLIVLFRRRSDYLQTDDQAAPCADLAFHP
jgi:hypothetical protein